MFYRFDFGQFMFNMMFFSILIVVIFSIGNSGGYIKIERPYKTEYNQCQTQLEVCKESLIPKCPVVKVDCGWENKIMPLILILYMWCLIGFIMYKIDKQNKPLKKKKRRIKNGG